MSGDQITNIQTASKFIYDGRCIDAEAKVCTPNGPPLLENMSENINLGALALIGTQDYLQRAIGQATWDVLSREEQLRVLAVGYKLGPVATGNAIVQAQTTNEGQPPSWSQIVDQLMKNDATCAAGQADCSVNYADKVVCYAEHTGESAGNPCSPK